MSSEGNPSAPDSAYQGSAGIAVGTHPSLFTPLLGYREIRLYSSNTSGKQSRDARRGRDGLQPRIGPGARAQRLGMVRSDIACARSGGPQSNRTVRQSCQHRPDCHRVCCTSPCPKFKLIDSISPSKSRTANSGDPVDGLRNRDHGRSSCCDATDRNPLVLGSGVDCSNECLPRSAVPTHHRPRITHHVKGQNFQWFKVARERQRTGRTRSGDRSGRRCRKSQSSAGSDRNYRHSSY
jgi:hypothetical protein